MVQLTHLAARYPHELSGGQQQRVALARALVIEPAILLLDEPFGALDKKLREDMQIQLKDIQSRLKITTIMVTHDQEEALTISDRIAVMNEGRIEQYGTPAQIYDRPATRFVARFIGTSNLFDGEVVARRGKDALVRTKAGIVLTATDLAGASSVSLSVRPEAIRLSAPQGTATPDADSTAGSIRRIIYRGPVTEYHVELESGQMLISSRSNGENASDLQLGSDVCARWDRNAVQVLGS